MPLTTDLASWRTAPTITLAVVLAAIALYAFRACLAGRPAFRALAEEAA